MSPRSPRCPRAPRFPRSPRPMAKLFPGMSHFQIHPSQPGDRMIKFGPFVDLPPGCFEYELWGRLKDKVRKFKPGDQPIPITFRRGAYEGTRSWPEPAMAAEATVPRSPLFFEAFRESRTSKFIAALEQALQQVKLPKPRVLEIGAGPVAVYSMCAARRGARAWAVEMDEELQLTVLKIGTKVRQLRCSWLWSSLSSLSA